MPAFACSGKRQQESRHKEVADSDASITWKNKSAALNTTPIICNDNRLIPGEPRYLMKKICLFANGLILATATATAQGASMQLTLDMPDCRMPPGKPLPDKYQALARKEKEFAWVRDAKPGDHAVNGNGWERIDGASNHTWFAFSKIDLDNDGMCDWYLHAASALSSGGDRDSINTLYLGRKNGWLRVGATVPANKPDELGFGNSDAEQSRYLFGEDISVIHDAATRTNYFITAFYSRHVSYASLPGYRIMMWDENKRSLLVLDKWEPQSRAAQVYAFFKTHGARRPALKTEQSSDTLEQFDPDTETFEIAQACDVTATPRTQAEHGSPLSRHLLARCKR